MYSLGVCVFRTFRALALKSVLGGVFRDEFLFLYRFRAYSCDRRSQEAGYIFPAELATSLAPAKTE